MKTLMNILLITWGVLGTSCQDWLGVKPKSEVKADVLFETEAGFKDALSGVYLLMTNSNAYGLDLTLGFNDVLARQYTLNSTFCDYYDESEYRYEKENVENRIARIWLAQYNTIANVNNILENLETHKDVLHPTTYGIIKGECLGLRAFLHFDLIRLFGYGNLVRQPENLKKLSLPYVKTFHKSVTPQSTTEQFLQQVVSDLEEGYTWLLNYDPYSIQPKGEDYYLPNDDEFFTKRNRYFNYFALRVTQARVYLWMGERGKALECAREIISRGTAFSWISEQNITNGDEKARDLTFSTEHILSLNVYQLQEKIDRFINPDYVQGNMNYDLLYHSRTQANDIYEIEANIGASDYRYMQWYDKDGDQFALRKFVQVEKTQFPDNMPLIRKSEAYYIAAECLNETDDAANRKTAIAYLEEVRKHRGIVRPLDENLSQEEVREEIYKEYRKEFISEGQLFYFYKRLGYTTIPGSVIPADERVYKLPMPEVEIDFGGRNE